MKISTCLSIFIGLLKKLVTMFIILTLYEIVRSKPLCYFSDYSLYFNVIVSAGHLYWVDKNNGSLERVDLDGNKRKVIWSYPNGEFIRVAILGQYIYVTDFNIT